MFFAAQTNHPLTVSLVMIDRCFDTVSKTTLLIPVFNEEQFFRHCLESAVNQVDHVIIGDNASTDGTEAIGREFADKYQHVQYIRRDTNVGAAENLARLAQMVKTEFVIQIGAHDELPENYIATLKNLLNANPDAACAYGNCSWLELDGTISQALDFASVRTGMLDDDPYRRAASFFYGKQPCDLIFGLFRSSSAIPIFAETKPIAGCDHILVVAALLDGKFVYAPDTTYLRRMVHPNDNDKDYMTRIVGERSSQRMSRDYMAAGKQIVEWCWKHHDRQNLSSAQKKDFRKLLFQIALKFDTPIGHPFWDSAFFLRGLWRKLSKLLKYKLLPGYAKKKGYA